MQSPSSPAPQKAWAVLDVVRWTTDRFIRHGIESARLDAELLAGHAFGLTRIELYTQFDKPLAEAELAQYRELVRRRLAGEPVAYLVGHKEFWSLDLLVDKRVLVPRPDTETLVEEALDRLRAWPGETALRLADVATGSGAVALSLAKEHPTARAFATDVSPDALAVATANAARLHIEIELGQGHLTAPLAAHAPFHLITANLPYIPSAEIAGLSAEVRSEPHLALDGGADGLDLVRELVGQAGPLLVEGGCLALEIGAGQAPAVAEHMRQQGFNDVRTRLDLGGIERVVSGLRGTS